MERAAVTLTCQLHGFIKAGLAPLGIGDAHHGHFGDPRVLRQDGLDLRGSHGLAAGPHDLASARIEHTDLEGHDHRDMPAAPAVPAVVSPALDVAPELAVALATRWSALDSMDRSRAVVLVAHGPETDDEAGRWVSASSLRRASARSWPGPTPTQPPPGP